MNATTLKDWFGQSTTGQGFSVLLVTLSAALSGQMPWPLAVPALLGSAVLIVWPQNIPLSKAVTTLATDGEAALPLLLQAYSTGLKHGVASVPVPAPVAAPVVPPAPVAPLPAPPVPAPVAPPALPPVAVQ